MSEAAVNAALRRMGYDTKTQMTGHGVCAMARTILLGVDRDVIEHQLSHRVPDALGNQTKFLRVRRAMMQRWVDYLDKLKAGVFFRRSLVRIASVCHSIGGADARV